MAIVIKKSLLVLLISGLFCSEILAAPNIVRRDRAIPNQYIVVLSERYPAAAMEGVAESIAASYGLEVVRVWGYALSGFLAYGSDSEVRAMAEDPRIDFIEENFEFDLGPSLTSGTVTTDYNYEYLWHLDRLDEPYWPHPNDSTDPNKPDSTYNMCTEGRTVYSYVIDTGIRSRHREFDNRVALAVDFSDDRTGAGSYSSDTTDGCLATSNMYHGTSVASALAGENIGAARTNLVSLKIFECSNAVGQTSWLLSALDWITNPNSNPYIGGRGVINLSGFRFLWDTGYSSVNTAARNVVASTQFPFFTSADNYSADACQFAPNAEAYTASNTSGRVIVVGATSTSSADNADYKWQTWNSDGSARIGPDSGSNGGPCVSIFAPGTSIYLAKDSGDDSDPSNDTYHRLSGTSFASPLAAAVAARWIETRPAKPLWYEVYDFLINTASATVYNAGAVEQWACVASSGSVTFHRSNPTCASGTKYYYPPYASTAAKMLYWDEGACQ